MYLNSQKKWKGGGAKKTPGERTPGGKTPGEVFPGERTPGEKAPGEKTVTEQERLHARFFFGFFFGQPQPWPAERPSDARRTKKTHETVRWPEVSARLRNLAQR